MGKLGNAEGRISKINRRGKTLKEWGVFLVTSETSSKGEEPYSM